MFQLMSTMGEKLKLGSVKINFHKYILVVQHMLLVVQHMLFDVQHMLSLLQHMYAQ